MTRLTGKGWLTRFPSASSISVENHVPAVWSAGVPFLCVPVKDHAMLAELDFDPQLWERVAPLVGGHLAFGLCLLSRPEWCEISRPDVFPRYGDR